MSDSFCNWKFPLVSLQWMLCLQLTQFKKIFFSLKKTKWACNGKQLRQRDSDCQTYLVKNANISPKRGYILPDFKKVRGCMVTSIISHTSFWPYSVEKNGSKIERPESENESSDGNSRNVLLKYISYITCWNWNTFLQPCNIHCNRVNVSWFLFSFVLQNVANKWVIVHYLKCNMSKNLKLVPFCNWMLMDPFKGI